MKSSIFSSIFISILLLVPILLKTLGYNTEFVNGLVNGLPILLILLIILNLIGLICLQTVSKFTNYIDTTDLIKHNQKQKKIKNHIAYKIYRNTVLVLLFGLLIYNRMHLTTIFTCIWWLSSHFFDIAFDKFMEKID